MHGHETTQDTEHATSDFHTSETIFFTPQHLTRLVLVVMVVVVKMVLVFDFVLNQIFDIRFKTNICTLGSDSMCSEHMMHVKS